MSEFSSWELNELCLALENRIRKVIDDPKLAHAAAVEAVRAFHVVRAEQELIETTPMASPHEEAIQQRWLIARAPYGAVTRMRRQRQVRSEWEPA